VAQPAALSPPRAGWPWAVTGALLGLLLALIAFAPARWLAGALENASGNRVVLREPRGTVWAGSAQLLLTGGPGSTDAVALPTRVNWRLGPALASLSVQLSSECCTAERLRLQLAPRWGGARLRLDNGQSQWPASLLAGLGTPWNTLQLDGNLVLSTESLSVEWVAGRLSIAGQAELKAQRVSSRLSTLRPMGSYRITVRGGETPTLQLDTLEGSLNLSGSGQWVGSRLRFSGTASAAPEREDALANLLNIIGRRNGARSIITLG
jgi:general secretion pathway protein N